MLKQNLLSILLIACGALGVVIKEKGEDIAFAPAYAIDIDEISNVDEPVEEGGLHVDRSVKSCLHTIAPSSTKFANGTIAATSWYSVLQKVAEAAKSLSDSKTLGMYYGVIDTPNGKMSYSFASGGEDVSTEALKETIQGSLFKAYRSFISNKYNHSWCVELTDGTKWKGYLLVGPDEFVDGECNANSSDDCVGGGENDDYF